MSYELSAVSYEPLTPNLMISPTGRDLFLQTPNSKLTLILLRFIRKIPTLHIFNILMYGTRDLFMHIQVSS